MSPQRVAHAVVKLNAVKALRAKARPFQSVADSKTPSSVTSPSQPPRQTLYRTKTADEIFEKLTTLDLQSEA